MIACNTNQRISANDFSFFTDKPLKFTFAFFLAIYLWESILAIYFQKSIAVCVICCYCHAPILRIGHLFTSLRQPCLFMNATKTTSTSSVCQSVSVGMTVCGGLSA